MVTDDPDDLCAEECEPLNESRDLLVPPVQSGEPAAFFGCFILLVRGP